MRPYSLSPFHSNDKPERVRIAIATEIEMGFNFFFSIRFTIAQRKQYPSYLTSIPSHTHHTSGVPGAGELLLLVQHIPMRVPRAWYGVFDNTRARACLRMCVKSARALFVCVHLCIGKHKCAEQQQR